MNRNLATMQKKAAEDVLAMTLQVTETTARPADALRQDSPIVLGLDGETLLQDDILINLQTAHPPFFGRFRLLVELVGTDNEDKVAARLRFRFYRDRGYEVKSMDMALS